VPKRTNLFQDVVSIIHEHLAEGSTIERSAMLRNRLTGELREVDVVLRSKAGPGYQTVIAVEATSLSSGPVDVGWVEEMIAKHQNLPTKVVLVSENSFSEQARKLAIAENMVPVAPEVMEHEDPALEVLQSMRSLWPKTVSLTPVRAEVGVDVPGAGIEWVQAPQDLHVFAEDGSHIELLPLVKALLEGNMRRTIEQIDLQNIAEDMNAFAVITVGPRWTIEFEGEKRSLLVERRMEGQESELLRIDGMKVTSYLDGTASLR